MIKKYSGVLFLMVAVLCWGPGPVVSKIALTEVPQLSFAFLGRSIAFIILTLIFLPKGYYKIDKKDFPMFVMAGFTGSVLNIGFFLYGLNLTTAMNSQAIFTTAPIITAILAHLVLHERIKLIQSLAIVIGFMGAIIIALQDFLISGSFHSGNVIGNFFVFLAAVSWVFYILISKKLSKKYSPITITCYSFMIATFVFAPLALFENINGASWISTLGINGIFGILYQAIFASVIATIAYQVGLKLTSAFTAGVILYLNPIVTVTVAFLFIGEKVTPLFLLGTVFIIIGSIVATQYETIKYHARKRFGKNNKKITL